MPLFSVASAGSIVVSAPPPQAHKVSSGPSDALLFMYNLNQSTFSGTDYTGKTTTIPSGGTVNVDANDTSHKYCLQTPGSSNLNRVDITGLTLPTAACTFMCWAKAMGGNNGEFMASYDSATPTVPKFAIRVGSQTTSQPRFRAVFGSAYIDSHNASPWLNTNWHHVAVVFDGAAFTMRAYMDGVAFAEASTSVAATMPATNTHFLFANNLAGNNRYIDGSGDDFRIYSRALTAAEIQAVYAAGSP